MEPVTVVIPAYRAEGFIARPNRSVRAQVGAPWEVVICSDDGVDYRAVLEAQGICRGEILLAPEGEGGGYDPIFWVREAGMTYAQMPPHLRHKLGSRGKAARAMAPDLKRLLRIERAG